MDEDKNPYPLLIKTEGCYKAFTKHFSGSSVCNCPTLSLKQVHKMKNMELDGVIGLVVVVWSVSIY